MSSIVLEETEIETLGLIFCIVDFSMGGMLRIPIHAVSTKWPRQIQSPMDFLHT